MTASDTEVRVVGPEASELLAALYAECLSPAWSAATIASLLSSPGGHGWIAAVGERPVGLALIREAADEAEILAIGVLPSERRKGVGRALLSALTAYCAAHHLSRLFLEVAKSNVAARHTYETVGFRPVGHRRNYYRSKSCVEDAIVMRLNIV
ncbi:MAG: ribosomal protein S18-alanine N-acetyltransferase [Pseudomonadota bacterium]